MKKKPVDKRRLIIEELKASDEKIKRNCEKSFSFFFRWAWDIIEKEEPLRWNWHYDILCNELQNQAERIHRKEPKEYDLLINVPPRSGKSRLCTVLFMAWCWIRFPDQKFVCWSYSESLSMDHAVDSRSVIQSNEYQEWWSEKFSMAIDQNAKTNYRNNKGGHRISTSVGGRGTGSGGNYNIVDDPINAMDGDSAAVRLKVIKWWKKAARSRLNNAAVDIRIVIMQRVHEDDLSGHILANSGTKYKHICIPAEDSGNISPPYLKKFYVNGLFFPDRFSQQDLDDHKDPTGMGPYDYAGQYQQEPSPPEGGLFKRKNWVFWRPKGVILPDVQVKHGKTMITCKTIELDPTFDMTVGSWDMAFKDFQHSDHVAGWVVAKKRAMLFLLDRDNGVKDFNASVDAVVAQDVKWGSRLAATLVEDKANGPAVINFLHDKVNSILPVTPKGSKFARAMPLGAQQEAGQVVLPHPGIAPWVMDVIDQFAMFPEGSKDDDVDSISQARDYLFKVKRIWTRYKGKQEAPNIDYLSNNPSIEWWITQWADAGTSSIVLCQWNAHRATLIAFGEVVVDSVDPTTVLVATARMIRSVTGGKHKNHKQYQWLGSPKMFGSNATEHVGDISAAYEKLHISLRKNNVFDEMGHILMADKLFSRGRITISQACPDMSKEAQTWAYAGNAPEPGHGLVRAFTNLCGMLWECRSPADDPSAGKGYTKSRSVITKKTQSLAKQNRFADIAKARRSGRSGARRTTASRPAGL